MADGPESPAASEAHGTDGTPSENERLERDPDVGGAAATPDAAPQIADVVQYGYEALIDRLHSECRRIVATAHSEAEVIRNEAREDSRRRVSSAHREEATMLARAADRQSAIYRELQDEVHRRLEEIERQRESVLAAARAEADEIRREANDTQAQARAALRSAQEEARAIVVRAQHEAVDDEITPTTSGD